MKQKQEMAKQQDQTTSQQNCSKKVVIQLLMSYMHCAKTFGKQLSGQKSGQGRFRKKVIFVNVEITEPSL